MSLSFWLVRNLSQFWRTTYQFRNRFLIDRNGLTDYNIELLIYNYLRVLNWRYRFVLRKKFFSNTTDIVKGQRQINADGWYINI